MKLFCIALAASAFSSLLACTPKPAAGPPVGQAIAPAATLSAGDYAREHAAGVQWFRDAKFGLFIHWGIYSVPEGEWKGKKGYGEWFQLETRMPGAEYAKFAEQFNPEKFNAGEWARFAKAAGMQYMVITAKHHDGFAMYDSKVSDYNVVKATPWGRDPLKELGAACKEQGIAFCVYYSLPDWHHPEFPQKFGQSKFHGAPNPGADLDKYIAFMKAQLGELLTNYGPIGVLWFDDGGSFEGIAGPKRAELTHAQEIIDLVHQLQPRCVINDRLAVGGDYGTPEQRIPGSIQARPFEACMSLNKHWSYNKADKDFKSAKTVITMLVQTASRGGNFLLDVGPMANGAMPPEAIAILTEVGDWLKVNGDAIYGTTASPLEHLPAGIACTQKPGVIYVHILEWPKSNQVTLPLGQRIKKAYALGDLARLPLAATATGGDVTITLPRKTLDPNPVVIAIEIDKK